MMPPSHHSPAAEMCQQDPDPLHQATRGLVVSRKHTASTWDHSPPPQLGVTASTQDHNPHTGSQPPPGLTAPTQGHSPYLGSQSPCSHSPHMGSQPPCRVIASTQGHNLHARSQPTEAFAAMDPTQIPSPDHLPGSLLPPCQH